MNWLDFLPSVVLIPVGLLWKFVIRTRMWRRQRQPVVVISVVTALIVLQVTVSVFTTSVWPGVVLAVACGVIGYGYMLWMVHRHRDALQPGPDQLGGGNKVRR